MSLTSSDGGLARLTSAVEEMSMAFSFVGAKVGKLVSSSSAVTGAAVPDTKLGIEEVRLTVPTPDCVGEEVKGEDFVIQSSLLT